MKNLLVVTALLVFFLGLGTVLLADDDGTKNPPERILINGQEVSPDKYGTYVSKEREVLVTLQFKEDVKVNKLIMVGDATFFKRKGGAGTENIEKSANCEGSTCLAKFTPARQVIYNLKVSGRNSTFPINFPLKLRIGE